MQARPVGKRGAGDLLGHAGLLEFLLVEQVDSGGFLADELGFLDREFLVGLELDLAGFFKGFLSDEGGHLAEFPRDLFD